MLPGVSTGASGDKRAFAEFMARHSIDRDDLAHLGVLLPPDDGWHSSGPLGGGYLRFRERLMFPVVDFRGDVTGYSGRILDARKKIAKYMNSPETPVFVKGEQLYGAFTARSVARRVGRAVLVEGMSTSSRSGNTAYRHSRCDGHGSDA